MRIEDIYDYFARPPVTFLTQEETACYILSVLLDEETYPSELIQRLEQEYPTYRLSDTILFNALNFLEAEGAVTSYWVRHGRGRPRRLYQLTDEWLNKAEELAQLWHTSTAKKGSSSLKLIGRTCLNLA